MNVQTGNGRTGGGAALSLFDGWLPPTVQIVVLLLLLLVVALLWRTPGFRSWWLPVCVAAGVVVAVGSLLAFGNSGLASDPAPTLLWFWIGVTGTALAVLVVGWRGARWWRRGLSTLVVPLSVVCVGLVLNQWVGYFATVADAWGTVTRAPLPNQVALADLPGLRGQIAPTDPGRVVEVSIPGTASGFAHRDEYVYLPPAWFDGAAPPELPALLMIGGEFATSTDWLRFGHAQATADGYARAHGGRAPVLVFADSGGTFNTDTECVDGPRGNAASHLTADVRPFVIDQFRASADPREWGVAGWSMGGTCALDLAVMHPELFDTFDDIAGDQGPVAGNKEQTIARLFGGDQAAWARYDPATVLTGHAPYPDSAGWIDGSDGTGPAVGQPPTASELEAFAALIKLDRKLCDLANKDGMACTLHVRPGRHSWKSGAAAFAEAFPWMADRLANPAAPASVPPSSPA